MIVDCHSHLASSRVLPEIFFDGWVENVRRTLPPGLPERHQQRIAERFRLGEEDPDGAHQLAQMDAAGIDAAVLLIIDFGIAFAEQFTSLEAVLQLHRDVAARHPGRFLIFFGIDPRRGPAGLELFERSLAQGDIRGLKLYPPCGYSPSDARLFPYYELCAQHQIPVLTHIGPSSPKLSFGHTEPQAIDEAAFRFPGVNFILGHAACVHRYQAALLAEYRPNVYLDISGFQVEQRRGHWHATLAYHKEHGLLRKLLFGTDWPIHRQYGAQKKWVDALADCVANGPLTEAEASWIRQDNPCEVLRVQR